MNKKLNSSNKTKPFKNYFFSDELSRKMSLKQILRHSNYSHCYDNILSKFSQTRFSLTYYCLNNARLFSANDYRL